MVEPGTIIDGRYHVSSRIGSGGMADVYLAEDQLLGRQVAVKLLHHHFAEDQEFVERFRREASSAAALSHPNIVGIFDRGEWQGTYYIAMEYVAGRSLKAIVREQGPLEPGLAIDIVVQILRAARSAHRRGVVHRDLKPHNVILDEEGRARVTDFGIARAGASDMTLTGSIMGTAQYLSPEQAQGQAVSAASDLYSVGVILYELLTGQVPFEGETAVAIAYKQVAAEPRPPSTLNPALPAMLDGIVLHALAKDPERRFRDADEFIAVLLSERAALPASAGAAVLVGAGGGGGGGPVAPEAPVPAGGLVVPPFVPVPLEPPPAEAEEGRRKRVIVWALALALVAAAVATLLLFAGPAGKVQVPNVTRQSEQAAVTALRREGLSPVASQATSVSVPIGFVIAQRPAAGSHVRKGTRVLISISTGPGSAALPKVEGLSEAHALSTLRKAGFKPASKRVASPSVRAGRVIGTEPPTGTELQVGSGVSVLVSTGPEQAHVPNLIGDSRSAAEAAITGAGLRVGAVTNQPASGQSPNTVIAQSPRAGTAVPAGTVVGLTVAQPTNEVSVPGVVGQEEARAAATLGAAGFSPKVVHATTSDPSKVGVVLRQSPSAGRKVRKGATVTLTVGAEGAAPTPTTPTTPTTTTTTTSTTPPPAAAAPVP